jgi:DNA processing protein
MSLATVLDSDYPAQLLTVHQRPPFVMYRGALKPDDAGGVAVVGTRTASPKGLRQAAELAEGLAVRGVPVVSGLAAGIDAAALSAVLQVGGRAVAVIGTGLRRSYPRENESLQQRIGEAGAVISQFWPDAPPTRTSFPMRNAVMSGYAAATVVVEAPWKSGARMQARLALQHGRTVFLLSSLLEHDWAREYALRPGAIVVTGIDDVLATLERVTSPVDELTWA